MTEDALCVDGPLALRRLFIFATFHGLRKVEASLMLAERRRNP